MGFISTSLQSCGLSLQLEWSLGLFLGVVHHFICQYPVQLDILTSLIVWMLCNLVFLVSTFLSKGATGIFSGVFVFNNFSVALAAKALYNVVFRHRGIPTQLALSATDWGFWRYSIDGTSHLKIAALHRALGSNAGSPADTGDAVRIQPNHISFISVQAIEDIHSTPSLARKGAFYKYVMKPPKFPTNIFNAITKERHSFLRRTIAPSFTQAALNELEPVLKQFCLQFIDAIGQVAAENNGVVDMNDWFNRLAFDIAGKLSFGENLGALQGGEQHFVIHAIHGTLEIIRVFMYIPWVAQFLLNFPTHTAAVPRYKVLKFVRGAIQTQMRTKGEKTIVANIMQTVDPETGIKFTETDMVSSGNTFIAAGSDTTSIALTFLMYQLLANRQHWERLSLEIRTKYKSSSEIAHSSLLKIPFLEAAIHEILRLRPPAPSNLQREVPAAGMMIDGTFVAGGTTVSTPTYAIHHDERNFSNPELFIPTRWIENERGGETCNRSAWIPFSYGPRNCIGKPLALMELRLAVAMFVWHFDAEFVEKEQEEPFFKDAFAALRSALPLRLTPVCR